MVFQMRNPSSKIKLDYILPKELHAHEVVMKDVIEHVAKNGVIFSHKCIDVDANPEILESMNWIHKRIEELYDTAALSRMTRRASISK